MITIHHLGVSQSDRVVWLMEELGLPYDLKWYNRGADRLAPPEYLALHPAATAPVIDDGDLRLTESAVILEHICHKHGGGRFTRGPADDTYSDYLYWMQFNNSILGLYFAKMALAAGGAEGDAAARMGGLIARRQDKYGDYLEQKLGEAPYLAGQDLSCADIMMMFNLTTLPLFADRLDKMPNTKAYIARVTARPAYVKAMEIAGPKATAP